MTDKPTKKRHCEPKKLHHSKFIFGHESPQKENRKPSTSKVPRKKAITRPSSRQTNNSRSRSRMKSRESLCLEECKILRLERELNQVQAKLISLRAQNYEKDLALKHLKLKLDKTNEKNRFLTVELNKFLKAGLSERRCSCSGLRSRSKTPKAHELDLQKRLTLVN